MVVGWYHSHPGFGCWLSGVDINTQQVGEGECGEVWKCGGSDVNIKTQQVGGWGGMWREAA